MQRVIGPLNARHIRHDTASVSEHEHFDVAKLSERFEVNKFQHREVERQEQLRRQLGLRTDLPLTHGLAEPQASAEDDQVAAPVAVDV